MRISAASMKWPLVLLCVVGIGSWFVPVASAGLATTPFAMNLFGPDAGLWRGSFSASNGPIAPPVFNDAVDGDVEWAVFAPGKFALFLAAEHPGAVDPSGPGEVIYAYQITDVNSAAPSGLDGVSVGLDMGDEARIGSVSPTSVAMTGTAVPTFEASQATQALWNFAPIAAGGDTRILVFSSVFAPELDSLRISSGLASAAGPVGSISDRTFTNEVPEPAGLALLALGAATLLAGRRLRG